MAIQMGATIYDLEEVELCYAPQFGSAKDPVNFAGMVAANVLRGDMPGRSGAPTSASGSGAPSARTTARTATPGTTSPRPGPFACLPLGRRRPGGISDDSAAPLLRAGAVERQGPHPQGAPVRPDQQRGQPRRGREGVLLLPRQHADPLLHEVPVQVSPGEYPYDDLVETNRRRSRRRPSTSCSTPASSTTTATSTSSSSTPRPAPKMSSSASPSTIAGRRRPGSHLLPTLWFRNQGKLNAVNPAKQGTKVAAHYRLLIGAGQTQSIRLRLVAKGSPEINRRSLRQVLRSNLHGQVARGR
jgi:hypothetical protein